MNDIVKITVFSDGHNKYKQITDDLIDGDLILFAGDSCSMGYQHEVREFCKWYSKIPNYDHKVFISGNHDWLFMDEPEKAKEIIGFYGNIVYLEDDLYCMGDPWDNYNDMVKIWGSPWQPRFLNWAFNLDRGSKELKEKWDEIPPDTDILITHGPPQDILDMSGPPFNERGLGCNLLRDRILEVKPKIHVFGHVHGGYGYKFDGNTHYFNASILNEKYEQVNKPISFEWNRKTNEIKFL
jgi:predicted phosphohydrolase